MQIEGLIAYFVALAVTAGIYAVFCLGLNIQWGYTGLFNIGIAGFFCIGAYLVVNFEVASSSSLLFCF